MKRFFKVTLIFILLTGQVSAEKLADNPLEPLYSAKKVKWAVQIDGTYPVLTQDPYVDKWTIKPGEAYEKKTFYFNISKPSGIRESYLYIFTSGFDCLVQDPEPCETWIVKFNGNALAVVEHTLSQGGEPRGDGNGGLRQTVRFKVEPSEIVDGKNSVFIQGIDFDRKDHWFIDGMALVTFYSTKREHEYWVYDGLEYLQPETVLDDFFYEEELFGATYPEGSKGTLYTFVGIQDSDGKGFEDQDAIYFNGNLLEPEDSNFLLETQNSSRLDILKFDVTDFLNGRDTIRFTYKDDPNKVDLPYFDISISPAIFILDIDKSDNVPPLVTFTTPLNNTSHQGNKTLQINFTVDDPEANVALEIDGSPVSAVKTPSGWSFEWNLRGETWTEHRILSTAEDQSGNIGTATLYVNVSKPAPEVAITIPTNGSLLTKNNVALIKFSVDDLNATLSLEIDSEEVSNESRYVWDPSTYEEKTYTIKAIAIDFLGQKGFDEIIVNLTSGPIPEPTTTTTSTTSTTIKGQTTTTTTSTTTTTTTTTTSTTTTTLTQVDLAINSLTLSTGSNILKKDVDVTAYILASNAGSSDIEATLVLYSDEEILESKTSIFNAYEVSEKEFSIRGGRLEPGGHTLKARILVQGEVVNEIDTSNNERTVKILVEENINALDSLKPILKWLAVIVVVAFLTRVVIVFIFQREEDYLK
jgi:hypothetical protein